jgi:hypothetical protein
VRGYQAGIAGLWEYAVPHISEPKSPAAGANYVEPLDGRWWWKLVGCTFALTTDANVANRHVSIQIAMADTLPLVLGEAPQLVAASATAQRFVGSTQTSYTQSATGTSILFSVLDFPILGGRSFSINVAAIQVGDTLTAIKLAWWRLPTNESIVRQLIGDREE